MKENDWKGECACGFKTRAYKTMVSHMKRNNHKPCRECGQPIMRKGRNATYCKKCSTEKNKER